MNELFTLVGAGRFERPTPCAQGRFRHSPKIACFLILTFQADAASLLRPVERFGIWRLWTATILTTSELRNQIARLSILPNNQSGNGEWATLKTQDSDGYCLKPDRLSAGEPQATQASAAPRYNRARRSLAKKTPRIAFGLSSRRPCWSAHIPSDQYPAYS